MTIVYVLEKECWCRVQNSAFFVFLFNLFFRATKPYSYMIANRFIDACLLFFGLVYVFCSFMVPHQFRDVAMLCLFDIA